MFLKHLINPKPSTLIFFIGFCILFACLPLLQFDVESVFMNMKINSWIILPLSIALPFFISMGLNNMIYEKNIIRKENLLISFIFILTSCSFTNTLQAWVGAFLLLFLFNYLLDSYQKELPFSQFYNASFLLAILTFIFPNSIYLIFIIVIAGINYSNLNFRIIITIILGLITPYLFYFIFSYISNIAFLMPQFFDFSQIKLSTVNYWHLSKKIWVATVIIILLFSFIEIFKWLYKKSIKSRRTFMTIIWFLIFSTIIALHSSWQYFYFTLIPISIIMGNYFVYTKNRKIANILFLLLVISSFYYKYMIALNV